MKKLLAGMTLSILLAAPALAGEVQYDIALEGITCPFCVATSERALKKIEGVKTVSANLETGIIKVCAADTVEFTEEELTKLFRKKGFTFVGMSQREGCGDFEDTSLMSDEELAAKAEEHAKLSHDHDE